MPPHLTCSYVLLSLFGHSASMRIVPDFSGRRPSSRLPALTSSKYRGPLELHVQHKLL